MTYAFFSRSPRYTSYPIPFQAHLLIPIAWKIELTLSVNANRHECRYVPKHEGWKFRGYGCRSLRCWIKPRCGAFLLGYRTKKCTGSQHCSADARYPDLTSLEGRIDSETGVYSENRSSTNGGSDGSKLLETGLIMMTLTL